MAAFSSKNSSTCTSNQFPRRPNNPTPRNSEMSNPMRRSFSGSPFGRPSPVISGQRDHQRRDNVVASYDYQDKENSKDQCPRVSKSGSPVPLTKDTKNFMSPTISAASKINPSPRKKILVDRNEPAPTWVSSFDGKGLFSNEVYTKPEKHSNQKKEVSFDATVTYLEDQQSAAKIYEDSDLMEQTGGKDDLDLDLDAFPKSSSMENDLVNLDPSFKISPRARYYSRALDLAPLDADPSVQTPFSESDADPLMPPYDPKTNYLSPRPQFLHYRPNAQFELYLNKDKDGAKLEDYFSLEHSDTEEGTEGETVTENSQKASEEEMLVSESNPVGITKTSSGRKLVSKPLFFTKSKLTALLLLVAISCLWLSISHSPIMDPSVFNNLEFPQIYIPPELIDFAKNNVHVLTQQLQTRLCNCYSYILNMLSSHREWYKLNSLMYPNLTTLLLFEDGSLDHGYFESEVGFKDSVLMATAEEEFETVEEIAEGDYFEEAAFNNPGVNEKSIDEVIEYGDPEHLEEEQENNPGVNEIADEEVIECDDREHLEERQQEAALNSAETGIGYFAMGLIGAMALLYCVRTRKSAAASVTGTPLEQVPSIEKLEKTVCSASKPADIGDSWPSECSFQSSSYNCRKGGLLGSNEAQSQERSSNNKPRKNNCKRESLASSDYSAASLSYGSFMKYEKKIADKHGNGDEQVVTPVRRSSRIRNQLTSP